MKLYWRYKKDGKWTWAPAEIDDLHYAIERKKKEEEE
jgi:hypothetical protein